MRLILFLSLLWINAVMADAGRISKVIGKDAYLLRNDQKILLSPEITLRAGDHIFSEDSYVVIQIYPLSQMSLSRLTQIKISEHVISGKESSEKTSSITEFISGMIRMKVSNEKRQEVDHKITTEVVSFAISGTEFEVSSKNKDIDIDVIEGVVSASSPFIHSFVPEIIKANEGLRFDYKKKDFIKRKFELKFQDHPGFESHKDVSKKWKNHKKLNRNAKRKRSGK